MNKRQGEGIWPRLQVCKNKEQAFYNKQNRTRDNDVVESHDQEESKLISAIIAHSGAHTTLDGKIIKSPLNKE